MIVTVTPNPGIDRTLTVPHITFNQVLRATALRQDWGGKGVNVSRALQALGVESVAMGFVGGTTGRTMERGLNELGITTDFVHIADETRTNIVITETSAERHVKVNESGPTVQPGEIGPFFDRVRERVRPGDIWVLSGSLPPGVPPDFYAQLITLVQQQGARAFLDTSGEPLVQGCAAQPYLVKPNALEAQQVTGLEIHSQADVLQAAIHLLGQGISLVALSLGADGMLLASEQHTVWARPPDVAVQNSVGAGDALMAGMVWGLIHDLSHEEVARWAVACGTSSAGCEGVDFDTYAKVQALYQRTRVESASRKAEIEIETG